MTDTVKVLSDDALREIEAWKTNSYGSMVNLPVAKRDALCATVRALRAEQSHWESPSDEGTCRFCGNLRDVPHGHIRKCYCIPTIKRYVEEVTELHQRLRLEQTTGAEFKRLSEDLVTQLQSTNTALREQLAENARRHFDDARELERRRDELKDQLAQENKQRGLVIMSALINFVDWLDRENVFSADEVERGELVKRFLAAHSEGEGYFMQAEQIAEILGEPFKQEQP